MSMVKVDGNISEIDGLDLSVQYPEALENLKEHYGLKLEKGSMMKFLKARKVVYTRNDNKTIIVPTLKNSEIERSETF